MLIILKYNKITIEYAIYIKVFTDVRVFYLIIYTDDIINTINNDTAFPELTRFLKEFFEMKVQEGSVLKYLNFQVSQSPLGFSVDQTDHIIELLS